MKAKYIFGTLVCSAMALGFTSCDNDEFLNVTEYGVIETTAMYENDANAKTGLNGVYDMMYTNGNYDGDWGFKPNLFTGCHPVIDTQATGWDKDWNVQNWNATSKELFDGWKHAYAAICRANDYLAGLETSDKVSAPVKAKLEGEGRALRGFFYHWLGTTFGRVPMLATGENYSNTPTKPRAETYTEMWNFVIEDFKAAAELLDWEPMDGQYGRATKGMALSYLADCYMWKAYRLTTGANGQAQDEAAAKECYQLAQTALKQVLNSGTYELNKSFTTNWDPASAWGKEAIWVEQIDENNKWSGWSDLVGNIWTKFYTACPGNGGWGSLYLSWEWWSCYEYGDKRREGSGCTGPVYEIDPSNEAYDPQYEGWYVESVYGKNPYLQEKVGKDNEALGAFNFHCVNGGEFAPSIWSLKFWRTGSADFGAWSGHLFPPTPIYWKRLPNVMLDYAECCFVLGDDSEGWKQINALRERAFGKLEDGNEAELNAKYGDYYNQYASYIQGYGNTAAVQQDYPIPFGSYVETVADAETYYTALKAEKGFTSEVWRVAVNEERRKEFNCEWSLRPDMQRSNYMEDHVKHNYITRNNEDLTDIPWTNRDYEYNGLKMDMPIPAQEILMNPACDQNPAYEGQE